MGSSGIYTNNVNSLSAGTYTYTIKQINPSTGYGALSNIEFYVTYNSSGAITRVAKNSGNMQGMYNPSNIKIQILETKNSSSPIVPDTSFSMSLTTEDYTSGSRTTGAKYTLKYPNGSTLEYDMGNSGTATRSNIASLSSGTHTFTLTQTVSSSGYNNAIDINVYITFDGNGRITNVTTSNSDVRVNSYSNNNLSITIRERKVENSFAISISTPNYSSGGFILTTPNGENKDYQMSNGTAKHTDFKALGTGRYKYTITGAMYITGTSEAMNVYVTFDQSGKITGVSTDSKYISGNYNPNNISIYISR